MNSGNEIPVLSLGSMTGGVAARPKLWRSAVSRLALRVSDLRVGVESPLRVNIAFQIPGEVLPIDFAGVRAGRYSKVDRHLLVQAAVPDQDSDDPESVLLGLLNDAFDEAVRFARKKGLADDLPELRDIIAKLK